MSLYLSYIKSAFRNLSRIRLHYLINIIGLSIGLICFIIIMLYVTDEVSFDRYHSRADRIYRITSTTDFEGVAERSSSCPAPLGPTLVNDYPDIIEKMTRVFNDWSSEFYIEYENHGYREKKLFFVDSTFTGVFDVRFLKGNSSQALSAPFTALITLSTAKRYFGNNNPIGKVIKLEGKTNITITGLVADPPAQSHFDYDFLVSMSTLRMLWGGKIPSTWVYNPYWTYILLKENHQINDLCLQLPAFTKKYFYDAEKDHITLGIQKLTDIHLRSNLDYEIEPNGRITYVRILTIVALFILIIACINYINLSTAFATRRSRETAIRKVSGATTGQLVIQYIGESMLISMISLIIALALIEIILPLFNSFSGKEINSNYLYSSLFFPKIILLWLCTGIFSGTYPAFYQSRFSAVKVLKGSNQFANGTSLGRKLLVVLQFSLSITLITASLMAFDQLNFLRNTRLGFNKENILIIPVTRSPIVKQYESFKAELLKKPGISGVTAVDYIVGTEYNNHEFRPENYPDDKWQFYPALVIRDDFVDLFGIKIIAGRDYFKNSKTEAMESILINESMVKHLGWKSNEAAIGKKFNSRIGNEKIVGVFKDFNANSLHTKAGPLVLNLKEDPREVNAFTNFIAVSWVSGHQAEAINHIRETWEGFAEGRPFEYKLLRNELDKLYSKEEYLGRASAILSGLTILIAAMGLFGLVSFMASQRTREIGIRKVLGAETIQIIRLLTSGYMKLVLISILVAWPLSYFVINQWISSFAYSTEIKWKYFLFSALVSLLTTLIITGLRAIRSSGQNPAKTLKYE
ncbi:MAG: lipoprotein release ABC transporter permease [Bacteroidetes bacterium]|nr:MAG: lipoprotein release ABC transporter permease [Bacteroidota bacterium]